ncbi:MAG: hypothetical protein LBT56_08785 [Prevotellaceae bacterium]|jgi:nitrate reductase beta subunit|nr:hypothetical protein [Prevotellaceae bacterium]
MKKIKTFSRFYALLNQLAGADKEQLVYEFTSGRTSSLREMTQAEYNEMCDKLQGCEPIDNKAALSRCRSEALRALSEIGISNVGNDYSKVDNFCLQRSGHKKVFYNFNIDELKALRKQVEAIKLKSKAKTCKSVPMLITSTQIYA